MLLKETNEQKSGVIIFTQNVIILFNSEVFIPLTPQRTGRKPRQTRREHVKPHTNNARSGLSPGPWKPHA